MGLSSLSDMRIVERRNIQALMRRLDDVALVRTVKGTATQTSTSTSLTDITDLSFDLESDVMYHFKFMGTFQSAAATNGLGLRATPPTSPTYFAVRGTIQQAAAGTDSYFDQSFTATGGTSLSTDVAVANTNYPWFYEGLVQPSVSGSLVLSFRSENAGTQVQLNAGSIGILTRCG